jgi:catechol 2,3-dioxygenase
MEDTQTTDRMPAELTVGAVELTVADLDRSSEYYTQAVGLQVLTRDTDTARIGVPGRTFVILRERPGAVLPPSSSAGLSHLALQVPAPAVLARFVRHYTARYDRYELTDHVVAHSCYVFDPDGHCIELTCARPREEWRWQNGRPVLVADPLDLRHFANEPGAELPFDRLPAETEIGHVQLKVTDAGLAATEPFYRDVLGFTVEGRLGTMFLAVGVTEYRALFVFTNRFSPDGGEVAPEGTAHLVRVDLVLPSTGDLRRVAERLSRAHWPHELSEEVLHVRDPSGTLLRFTARESG